jgi:hypothetical protein
MNTFGKQPNCPASHEILAYVEGSLRSLAKQRIARHSMLCDFCGAEVQLFTKYTPSEEDFTPAPTPAFINVLGVDLPVQRAAAVERRRAA